MRSKKNKTGPPDSTRIRGQAEQKVRSTKPPALESMTREEIRQMFHEMQVRQLTAELENEQLRVRLEEYSDNDPLFAKLTENMLDLVLLADPSGNLKFIRNSLETLGYEPEALIGLNMMDFVHPEDLNAALETYADFVSGGDPPRIQFRCRCGDGSYLWLETRGTFLKDENGHPLEIVLSLRDITEQKATEEALRKSEQKFRHLFERAEEGILIVRGETVDFANPALERILGYPIDRITSEPFVSFIHPDDRETVLDLHFRIMRHEFSQKHYDFRVVTSKGTVKWVTVNGQVIDWEGAPANLGFVMDITDRKQAEQQLKESEERFSKAFRSSPAPQVISDIDTGVFIDVNDRWVEMLGYTREQLLGRSSKEVGIWADPGQRDRVVPKLHKNGIFKDETIEFRTSAGGTVYALWSGEAITLGNRPVMLSMIYDRTGQKQMEDALRESEQRLSLALDAVSDGVWDWRIDTNSVYFSPRWYTMLGYEPYELPQTFDTWRRLLHPADLPAAESVVDQHLTSAEPFELEFRMITKGGDYKWIFARGKTVEKDAQGNALRMLGTHMDITGRKQTEQQLRESEEKYRRIAENITDVVWTTDLNLNPTFISSSIQKLLGETPEEHMRRSMAEKYPPVYLDKIYQVLAEELEKENDPASDKTRARLIEVEHYKADGSTVWVSMNISAIRDENGSLVGLQGVTRDVTERKKREQDQEKLQAQLHQAQKMESVGRLAGGVAHDFNNKLAIINGYAEMAADMIDPSDPVRETIRDIHTAGQQSAGIVRQLLAFARKQTISPVQLDLNETISSMLKMLQRLIGENINLAWHPGSNLKPVKMDPSQVDQIMANLAVNARDAISDVGKLTIETKNTMVDADYCKSNPEAIPGRYVMIAVSDDGCGMEKEVKNRLFEPFFTTKEIGKGTGLGLPTIYGTVKQNNGFINVYSEPGKGTSFKLYFPSLETEESSAHAAKGTNDQVPAGTETILLVEDEKAILQMSAQMLERLGYTVQSTANPFAAVQLAKAYPETIHLLITDVVMPEMNGRDLSSQLIQVHPGLKTLFMSGYTADVIAHHGVLDQGVQFIQKPFSLRDLAKKVREVIEQG